VTRERETLRERLSFQGYRSVERLARALPARLGSRMFRALGRAAYHALPGVRSTVSANQALVLGRPPEDPLVLASVRQGFELYARYWHEAFLVVDASDEEMRDRFRSEGLENMERALEKGNGAILALPHMGNWDAAGRWMTAIGHPVVSVAERLRPERLYRLFLEHRRALGMDIIGLSGEGVGRQLSAALADNRPVALVADRDLTGRGIEVEMFGRPRRIPVGPALLALTTGAALIPAPVYTTPTGWLCVMHEPLEVETSGNRKRDAEALTRKLAAVFERAISAAPADWHMFQPGWPV
jgi:phosphatidylinositol dimannoside acyltransferase